MKTPSAIFVLILLSGIAIAAPAPMPEPKMSTVGAIIVPAPECGYRIEYVSNATTFDIGSFGSGNKDSFVLAINSSRFDLAGVRVKIGNDSIVFQTSCPDCEAEKWKTIYKEDFGARYTLGFKIYNEVRRDSDLSVSGHFKSAKGKEKGLFYVVSPFTIDTTGDEVRVSYESIDPC